MATVSFTRMEDGTEEDYLLLQKLEKPYVAMTADRIMRELMHQAMGWHHRTMTGLPRKFFARSCAMNAYGWSSTMHRFR